MADLELSAERGHLIETNSYDAALNWTGSRVEPRPGFRMNGHRSDCRCETCRPDIPRFPEQPEGSDRNA